VFVLLCFCVLFCALLVILSLLLVIMGGQHDGLFLSGSPPVFTFVYTCVFFSWQINSAAAAAIKGVVIDSGLSITDQVSAICRAAYYQLRQLRTVTRCLIPEATKTTVQAFICGLDYCNALLYGIADDLLRRLQSV